MTTLIRTLALFVLLWACGAMAAPQDRLVIATVAEASDLDPRITFDTYSYQRMYAVMEPLLTFGLDLGLEPRLAESWEFSGDGRAIIFTLREGVMFHHGQPFTAEDVRTTFEWILDPDNDAANRSLYADISSIEVVDDHTVVFHLAVENSFLLNNIARMPILPYDLADEEGFGSNPVGTGPYRFESWTRDDRMVLSAFEDYWGGAPRIATVEFRPITEDATRLLAFEAGDIDLYQGQIVPTELPRLEAAEEVDVLRAPGTGYTYVGFNTQREPLDDLRVRQAISHLIPREAIVERVLNGIGRPGISMLSPDAAWFNPDVPRFDYDPERAQELLEEAGIGAGSSLRLHTDQQPVRVQIAEILQFELQRLGLELVVSTEEFGTFIERIMSDEADYDMFILGWGGQLDPDRAMHRQFTSAGTANYAHYSNPRVDELLERGRRLPPDSQESIEVYQEAQAIIVEEAPFAYIFYTEEVGLHQPFISGWTVHPYSAAAFQDLHLVEKRR